MPAIQPQAGMTEIETRAKVEDDKKPMSQLYFVPPWTDGSKEDEKSVYLALRPIVVFGSLFGVMPISKATTKDPSNLTFSWSSLPTVTTLILLACVIFVTLTSSYYYFFFPMDDQWTMETVALRPREMLVYIASTIILLCSIRAARKLPKLLQSWDETTRYFCRYLLVGPRVLPAAAATNVHLSLKKSLLLTALLLTSATTEHIFHDISLPDELCPNTQEYFKCYYVRGHRHLANIVPYNFYFAAFLFCFNKLAVIIWNYQDIFIILLSLTLKNNFKVLSEYLKRTYRQVRTPKEWRRIREDHMALCQVAQNVDQIISLPMFLSYAINLYFLCIQVFYAIRPSRRTTAETIYFCASFYHFFVRMFSVTLSASGFYDEARAPLEYLQRCPSESYGEEVSRFITHLSLTNVAFTGLKLFTVNRSVFLAIPRPQQ